jgi:hypothetical protein
MKSAFSKKFGRQMVNEVSKRFNIKGVVKMGAESFPGIVSDNAQALVLDDLEFEVIRITCGIADRGGVCNKGSN